MKIDDDVYIFLKNFGFTEEELEDIYNRNSYLERVLDVDVEKRIKYFNSLGMSDEEVKFITLQQSNVLVYSLNRMKKIQKQYMEDGMDIEQYKEMLLNNIHILEVE